MCYAIYVLYSYNILTRFELCYIFCECNYQHHFARNAASEPAAQRGSSPVFVRAPLNRPRPSSGSVFHDGARFAVAALPALRNGVNDAVRGKKQFKTKNFTINTDPAREFQRRCSRCHHRPLPL